jgi:hypothetical protein
MARKVKVVGRSAKTGKFVTKKFAKSHPATTVNERVSVKKTKSRTGGTGPRRK